MKSLRIRMPVHCQADKDLWKELQKKSQSQPISEILKKYLDSHLLRKDLGYQTTTESENSLSLELSSTPIHTKEQLIQACQIDTDIWEVSKFRVSTWVQKEDGTQLYAVKCLFSRKQQNRFSSFLNRIEKGLYQYVQNKTYTYKPSKEQIAIINIYDAHLDKVSRINETGKETNIKLKCDEFRAAFDYLLSNIGTPERIIFPVGNDLFNTNDGKGTKKGTPQETYINYIDAFEIGLNLIRECIDKAAQIAPVYVPLVAGNHAEDLEYILGVCLKTLYSHTAGVEIDHSRLSRKYLKYGQCMFMFQHGDKMKRKIKEIPQIMAQEQSEMWSKTTQRYALFGDIHHEQTHELIGCTAMFLRSMSALDKWHHASGYVGSKKTAYAHIFSKCGKYSTTQTINF